MQYFRLLTLIVVCHLTLSASAQNTNVQPDKPETLPTKVKKGFRWVANPQAITPRSGKRNHVFYVGEPVKFELGPLAARYEIRDYFGNMVDQGDAGELMESPVSKPGWYKLYVYGKPPRPAIPQNKNPLDDLLDAGKPAPAVDQKLQQARELWGDILATTNFVVFRQDNHFPTLPSPETKGSFAGSCDQVARGVTGMGPQRYQANADKPEETIGNLQHDIAIDKQLYLPFDSERKRVLLVAFGGGTKNLDGVRTIVERFKDDVAYWEPRNEPNFGASPAEFVEKELKPLYETVKSVDSKLKVIGPGTVSYNATMLGWIEGFLKAGGAKYLDGFSFHAYNCCNGDVWMSRRCLEELNTLLARYDADKLEKWQTEQGYFACVYGAFQPRLQGRWTMVEMMVYEQFALPKEHNHLWYDRSHGFWDFPTWWENEDGSLNPAAALMRVWSEELYGTNFSKAYDFGPTGNNLYIGSLFTGSKKQFAAFMSAGSTDGAVNLRVAGGDKLTVVSAFGNEVTMNVTNGLAALAVPELPVYVRLAPGQTIEVLPYDWGANLARAVGVKVTASGNPDHPSTKSDTPADKRINNDPRKVVNGVLENWYRTLKKDDHPWASNVAEFPATVEIALPQPASVGRVILYAAPPWQSQGTLVDYELQIEEKGQWKTIERVQEPLKTFKVYSPPTRTTTDSYFSDRWVFQHQFAPTVTNKLRLLVHNVTYGGGATQDVVDAGGQTGPKQIVLREIEVYGQ